MHLHALARCLLLCLSFALTLAQSPSSTTTPSVSSNSSSSTSATPLSTLLTTITSLVPLPTTTPYQTTTSYTYTVLPLTLVQNGTALQYPNGTAANRTLLDGIGAEANATLSAPPAWNDTMGWVPFHIRLDGAYATLGAVLVLSGLPVAGLGGKNRWSSLAIVTAYAVMLFTLVLVLRFGVEPNLQPPSPNPPSATLRGLYLLACLISAFFGAAAGIFLYNLAKYWVCACGGFAFGWFLLATRRGGLVPSTLGRWGLLGGLTVGATLVGLVPVLHPFALLVATAWIGATAFVLGIDCFTRAGLKEFYVYNLGFHDLFPKLNGYRYPLTQTMQIELGILAAAVLIGAAVQFRILNMLQKRLKQMREEEEARIEAEEVSKAAERFKNVGTELEQWEEKHGRGVASGGSGAAASSVALPRLGFEGEGEGRPSSTLSLLRTGPGPGYEGVPLNSPPLAGTPTTARYSVTDEVRPASSSWPHEPTTPASPDPELESKMRLLAEVQKAREDVRASMEKLRSSTPGPSIAALNDASTETGGRSSTPGNGNDATRRVSSASSSQLVKDEAPKSEWERYVQERQVVTPPALSDPLTPTMTSRRDWERKEVLEERRERTSSMLEPRVSHFGPKEILARGAHSMPSDAAAMSRRASSYDTLSRPMSVHHYDHTAPRPQSTTPLGPPVILGSAARPAAPTARLSQQSRTMTYDELAERHRKRLSALQMPVTSKMTEAVEVEAAKRKWEEGKKREREEMRRKEKDREARRAGSSGGKDEAMKKAEEWRRSVGPGPGPMVDTVRARAREGDRSMGRSGNGGGNGHAS